MKRYVQFITAEKFAYRDVRSHKTIVQWNHFLRVDLFVRFQRELSEDVCYEILKIIGPTRVHACKHVLPNALLI